MHKAQGARYDSVHFQRYALFAIRILAVRQPFVTIHDYNGVLLFEACIQVVYYGQVQRPAVIRQWAILVVRNIALVFSPSVITPKRYPPKPIQTNRHLQSHRKIQGRRKLARSGKTFFVAENKKIKMQKLPIQN